MSLFATACGGSGSGVTKSTSATEASDDTTIVEPVTTKTSVTASEIADTTEGAPESTPVSTGADEIESIAGAQSGSIQIISQGSLRDPEIGTYTSGSSGSGFFISADGYAVTNNDVVAGAATLEVYVGGDLSTSYNARVIGVSECNESRASWPRQKPVVT